MTASAIERSQTVSNIYSGYYTDGGTDIVKRADEFYNANLTPWQTHYYEATIDRKVYLGDHRYLSRYTGLSYENQKFIFNESMPVLNMVTGRQRQYRKASQILPIHGSSNQTASQATKAIQSAYYLDDTYNKYSLAFEEALITGIALLQSWIDYRRDPICGDLRTEVFSADMMMMDAFWREMDLSDCQGIRTRKYLYKSQVKALLPGREEDVDRINAQAYYDTKFTYMPQQYNIRRKGVLAYDEFWYRTERKQTFLVDPETYESIEIEDDPELINYLRTQFPQVVITRENVPTVHLGIIVNNVAMYDGPNPMGIDSYPYTPCVAYHDLANNNYAYRYQGIIRNIRDQVYLHSYRSQLELDLLAAQFSGVDVEEDALVDDNDAFKVGPGKVRFFKKGRLPAVRDIPGAIINPVNLQVTEQLKRNIQSNAGVTPELLGTAEDNDVGITEQLRSSAALTTLQKLFDNLDLFQRNATRLHWDLIQKNYTPGKIRRMIEEEPTNEFWDKSFQKYDAVVTNAPLTATTKQLSFLQKYRLWKDGLPIPPDMLLEDLVIQDKDKLIASIQQTQERQQQMEMQQAQLQMQNQAIVNESLQSKAMSDRSLANEREGKLRLEQMQIVTALKKAQHEEASATLDTVKTARELEGMDVDNFVKIYTLIENMQNREDQMMIAQMKQAETQKNPKAV